MRHILAPRVLGHGHNYTIDVIIRSQVRPDYLVGDGRLDALIRPCTGVTFISILLIHDYVRLARLAVDIPVLRDEDLVPAHWEREAAVRGGMRCAGPRRLVRAHAHLGPGLRAGVCPGRGFVVLDPESI